MKKRILIVAPINKMTIGLCTLNLYKALQQCEGVLVKCVLVHKFDGGYAEFEDCEWYIGNRPSSIKRFFSALGQIRWLKKIKKEFQPDITISTLFSCSTINVLSGGKEKKIGIFHSPHSQVRATGWVNYQITLLIYRLIYPRLDFLYCVSNEVKHSILESFSSISYSKVKVVYNIHDEKSIIEKSLEKLNDDEMKIFSYPVILYCGRLDNNKAPDRLLKAFAKLKGIIPDVQLVIIGQDVDNLWPRLAQWAESVGIDSSVHYWGRKDNPYKFMKYAKTLVSCSYSEGLPGVLIESLLLNIPIVTTNSSEGVWEILSCEKDYNYQLDKIYIAKKGIITSNLSVNDENMYDADIDSLYVALQEIMNSKYAKAPFLFRESVKAENVIKNYISI